MSSHSASDFDDLANAETRAITEVVDALRFLLQGVENQKVGHRQVENMNVVANAGSVRRWVVRSIYRNRILSSERNLQDQGNQMRFRDVIFAVAPPSAGRVEVTQARIAQSVDTMEPVEHAFDAQLRLPVNVGRPQGRRFRDWDFVWFAVERRSGGKYEAWNLVRQNRFEQGQRVRGIIAEVALRHLHGFARFH